MTTPGQHVPVLLERCVALLAPAVSEAGAVMVDATVGLGGHSHAMLARFPQLRMIGLDRDSQALQVARERLASFADRTTLVQAVYDCLPDVLAALGQSHVQGVLMDLGVSSLQLDQPARGFSYAHDAPLDMRMDQSHGPTAADVLNSYPAAELARVLRDYGQERFARRIAERVVAERAREPFTRTGRLVALVRASVPAATRRTGGNPAKRTFQALRIEVNGELAALQRALPAAIEALAVHGRLVVLSYHSLEDRLVKSALAHASSANVPPDLPMVPDSLQPKLRLLVRSAQMAGQDEIAVNPRAASVRLRAVERVKVAA